MLRISTLSVLGRNVAQHALGALCQGLPASAMGAVGSGCNHHLSLAHKISAPANPNTHSFEQALGLRRYSSNVETSFADESPSYASAPTDAALPQAGAPVGDDAQQQPRVYDINSVMVKDSSNVGGCSSAVLRSFDAGGSPVVKCFNADAVYPALKTLCYASERSEGSASPFTLLTQPYLTRGLEKRRLLFFCHKVPLELFRDAMEGKLPTDSYMIAGSKTDPLKLSYALGKALGRSGAMSVFAVGSAPSLNAIQAIEVLRGETLSRSVYDLVVRTKFAQKSTNSGDMTGILFDVTRCRKRDVQSLVVEAEEEESDRSGSDRPNDYAYYGSQNRRDDF